MSAQATQSPQREGAQSTRTTLKRSIESEGNRRKSSEDQALNRACEACRVSKVRCLASPDPASAQCQRCAKAKRACIFAAPVKRRQRKRTDVRVAELEKEIVKMRDLIKTSSRPPLLRNDDSSESDEQEYGTKEDSSSVEPKEARSSTQSTSRLAHPLSTPLPDRKRKSSTRLWEPSDAPRPEERDIVDRGVISPETAEDLLNSWRSNLTYACPGVIINNDWTAAQLRAKKPLLFHAVMAAASHSQGSGLSDVLQEEAIHLFARLAFINGTKSVECIQGLLVMVAYYSPPKTVGQIQVYSWVNMAASMALELGLASKPRTHEQLPKRAIQSLQRISSPEELLEHCRTVLYLYVVCAGFSMRLKRPNILLFNSWMEECVGILEKSKLLDDKRTLAWLKLQRIADETNTAFGFDDASTSFSLSELRMQIILRIFDRKMQDWRKSVPEHVLTLSLIIEYHQNMLSMWEFGMDGGRYDVTDFRNRHLTLPALDDDTVQPESLLSQSALQINATTKCISEAHAILDCVLQVPDDHLQQVPNIICVRATYALVALLKADYSVGTDIELGEILDSQSLKVDDYLGSTIRKIHAAIGPQKCRIPSHWHSILTTRLQSWRDEYLEWKQNKRDLKRRKTQPSSSSKDSPPTPAPAPAPFTQPAPPPQPAPQPAPTAADQPADAAAATAAMQTQPYMANPYGWPADAAAISGPPPFSPYIGDFSTALQNGDLYLWNDASDSFGSWMPQGGLYADLGFGAMGGTGF